MQLFARPSCPKKVNPDASQWPQVGNCMLGNGRDEQDRWFVESENINHSVIDKHTCIGDATSSSVHATWVAALCINFAQMMHFQQKSACARF